MHRSCLFVFFGAEPGLGIDEQGGCGLHDGLAVLGGAVSRLEHREVCCPSAALRGL